MEATGSIAGYNPPQRLHVIPPPNARTHTYSRFQPCAQHVRRGGVTLWMGRGAGIETVRAVGPRKMRGKRGRKAKRVACLGANSVPCYLKSA